MNVFNKNYFKNSLDGWFRRRSKACNHQQFSSHNLYILPSGYGCFYVVVLLSLFTGAINYQISAAFLLCFLLVIIGFISMLESHRNLKGLTVRIVNIEDVECGLATKVTLFIATANSSCYGLWARIANHDAVNIETINEQGVTIDLALNTTQRGCFKVPKITFYSYFPMGLFCVWGYIYSKHDYFVYPQAINPGYWPQAITHDDAKESFATLVGDEDLYELKSVESPWTQAGRIAWKVAARGQGWYLKKFASPEANSWLFILDAVTEDDLEKSLSFISYWIQSAEKQGDKYGLELKGECSDIDRGALHMKNCLRQLATWA